MKQLIIILVFALMITACAPAVAAAVPTSISQVSSPLVIDFADAASLRNQLAFGTLKLEETALAITSEQARALLPYWQAILSMSGNPTTISDELTAVQNQIIAEMKPDQLKAIAALQITNAQLSAFYAEKGIVIPTPVPGVTKVPGSGKDLPIEVKQATQAAAAASGAAGVGQAAKTLLFDSVIKLVTERASK